MGKLFEMTSEINNIIGTIVTGMAIVALLFHVLKYGFERIKEDGTGIGVYMFAIHTFVIFFFACLFWILPIILEKHTISGVGNATRGFAILAAGTIYFKKRKTAEERGICSFWGHYIFLLLGWLVGRWVGILVVSIPLLAIYYYVMTYIALAVIPASEPGNKKERQNRFRVFLAYTWGLQMPFWKTASNIANEAEKRIDGVPGPFKNTNGMVWMYSHQVAGISKGPEFRADGPGLIFTGKDEQPFEIVDLRNLTRKSKINAISRDGIPFKAEVTVTFAVDNETWTRDQHQKFIRANTMLRGGRNMDKNLDGTFPYSQARVKAALSNRSKKATPDGEATERWDDHVLTMAEEAAREVLSERSIEELWKARENEHGSAAEEITSEMKLLLTGRLHQSGIRLFSVKAADFSFKDRDEESEKKDELKREAEDKVEKRQLATWSVDWEKHRAITLANGQAESERIQQEARAYAHSVLLTAIAEGLQEARALHPNLPRYIIALRFIGALEKMLEGQPAADEKEKTEIRASLHNAKERLLSHSHEE